MAGPGACLVSASPGGPKQPVVDRVDCVRDEFRDGVVERCFYWRLPYHDDGTDSVEALERRFRLLLKDATRHAIDGPSTVGTFLSGGTDSSTVTALLTELTGKPAQTYSIGFAWEGFDEMKYARITAQHLGARAHEYYVTPGDIVEAIPIIARAYDEPFGNDSAAPTYFCAKMAREDGVQVLLAGDGGDEIFGGNTRYAKQKVFEAYGRIPNALRRGLIEPLAFALPGSKPHQRRIGLRLRKAGDGAGRAPGRAVQGVNHGVSPASVRAA